MNEDEGKLVKKCDKCQRHADAHAASPTELSTLTPPLAFRWVGNRPSGALPHSPGTSEIPDRSYRLFHKVDRGRAIGHHQNKELHKLIEEEHHGPIWNSRSRSQRQWDPNHRQGPTHD